MQPISRSALRPGDVLLSVGIGPTSEAIRAFDGGRYSHAAMWTGQSVVESTTPHVIEHSLDESLTKHPRRYVDAYRHKSPGAKEAVVVAAEQYVDRRYSYGDLALAALVVGTTAWLPTTATQDSALLRACGLNQFLDLVRSHEGKLVTCTELVARSYFEGGVPIRVIPKGGNRFDRAAVVALFKGMGDLWHEATAKRGISDDAMAWHGTQVRLRAQLMALTGLDPDDERALIEVVRRALAAMVAGGEWGANLVTPSYLETSPDLDLVGRIYPSPGELTPGRPLS